MRKISRSWALPAPNKCLQQVCFVTGSLSEGSNTNGYGTGLDGKQNRRIPLGLKILGGVAFSITNMPMALINKRIEHLDITADIGVLSRSEIFFLFFVGLTI
jgi:hypothetical protein